MIPSSGKSTRSAELSFTSWLTTEPPSVTVARIANGTRRPAGARRAPHDLPRSSSGRCAIQLTELSEREQSGHGPGPARASRSLPATRRTARERSSAHGGLVLDRRETPRRRRARSTTPGRHSGSGDGSIASFQTSAKTPPGRSTRAISATASSFANQWNACAAKTASTDASGSGIDSAAPGMTLCLGNDRLEDRPHSVQRLDRDHALVASREHAGELAGAGTEVEHGRAGSERQ